MITGNQKRKYACNRYEDISKQMNKVLDKFGDDENVQNLGYWINKLQKERAAFRKKAVKYDELQSILEEYNVTPENIREVLLTGQMFRNQPTLSECIKEWEDRGFEVENTYRYLSFRSIDLNIDITIDKKVQDVQICVCHYNYAQTITYDLHNLIHKTLKALEEMKDD